MRLESGKLRLCGGELVEQPDIIGRGAAAQSRDLVSHHIERTPLAAQDGGQRKASRLRVCRGGVSV
ncbi:MAG: hypothetical protein WKH64_17350 [Chloroflexia bacterium]